MYQESKANKFISLIIVVGILWSNGVGIVGAQVMERLSDGYEEYLEQMDMYGRSEAEWQHRAMGWISGMSEWEGAYDRETVEAALEEVRRKEEGAQELARLAQELGRKREVYEYIEGANRVYLYKKREGEEEWERDGEGRVVYKEELGLDEDVAGWKTEVAGKIEEEVARYGEALREAKEAAGLEGELYEEYVRAYRNELEMVGSYEEQRFIAKRTLDSSSVRAQVARASAGAEVEEVIEEVEEAVGGISEIGESKEWIAEYGEEYETGMASWKSGLEQFVEKWGEWEEENIERIEEGRREWLRGYEELQSSRREWEAEMLAKYEEGRQRYQEKRAGLEELIGSGERVREEESLAMEAYYEEKLRGLIGGEEGYYYTIGERIAAAEQMKEYWEQEGELGEVEKWEEMIGVYEGEREGIKGEVRELYRELLGIEEGEGREEMMGSEWEEVGYGDGYQREVVRGKELAEEAEDRLGAVERLRGEIEDYSSGRISADELAAKIGEVGEAYETKREEYRAGIALIREGARAIEAERENVREASEEIERIELALAAIEELIQIEQAREKLGRSELIGKISGLNEERETLEEEEREVLGSLIQAKIAEEVRIEEEEREKFIEQYIETEEEELVRGYIGAESELAWIESRGIEASVEWVVGDEGEEYYKGERLRGILREMEDGGIGGEAIGIIERAIEIAEAGEVERAIAIGGSEESEILKAIESGAERIEVLGEEYGAKSEEYKTWEETRGVLTDYRGLRKGKSWESYYEESEGLRERYTRGDIGIEEYLEAIEGIVAEGGAIGILIQQIGAEEERKWVLENREEEEVGTDTEEVSEEAYALTKILENEYTHYIEVGDVVGEVMSGMMIELVGGAGIEEGIERMGRILYTEGKGSDEVGTVLAGYRREGIWNESNWNAFVLLVEREVGRGERVTRYIEDGGARELLTEEEAARVEGYYGYEGRRKVGEYLQAREAQRKYEETSDEYGYWEAERERIEEAMGELLREEEELVLVGGEVSRWAAWMTEAEALTYEEIVASIGAEEGIAEVVEEQWGILGSGVREELYEAYYTGAREGEGILGWKARELEKEKAALEERGESLRRFIGEVSAAYDEQQKEAGKARRNGYRAVIGTKEAEDVIHWGSYKDYRSEEEISSGVASYDFSEVQSYGAEAEVAVGLKVARLVGIVEGIDLEGEEGSTIASLEAQYATVLQKQGSVRGELEKYNKAIYTAETSGRLEKILTLEAEYEAKARELEEAGEAYGSAIAVYSAVAEAQAEKEQRGEALRRRYEQSLRAYEEYEIVRNYEESIYLGGEEIREREAVLRKEHEYRSGVVAGLESVAQARADALAADERYGALMDEYKEKYEEELAKAKIVEAIEKKVGELEAKKATEEAALAQGIEDLFGIPKWTREGAGAIAQEIGSGTGIGIEEDESGRTRFVSLTSGEEGSGEVVEAYIQGAGYQKDLEAYIRWITNEGEETVLKRWGKALWQEARIASGKGNTYIEEYEKVDTILQDGEDHYEKGVLYHAVHTDRVAALAKVKGDTEEKKWYEFYKLHTKIEENSDLEKGIEWEAEAEYYRRIATQLTTSANNADTKRTAYNTTAIALAAIGSIFPFLLAGATVFFLLANAQQVEKEQSLEMRRQVNAVANSSVREKEGTDITGVSKSMKALGTQLTTLESTRASLAALGYGEGVSGVEVDGQTVVALLGLEGEEADEVERLYASSIGSGRTGENIVEIVQLLQEEAEAARESARNAIAHHIDTNYYVARDESAIGETKSKTEAAYEQAVRSYREQIEQGEGEEAERSAGFIEEMGSIYGSSYEKRNEQMRMLELQMSIWEEGSGEEARGLLEDIETGLLGIYASREESKNILQDAEWQEARESLQKEEDVFYARYLQLVEKSDAAWDQAERKYRIAHREWEQSMGGEFEEIQSEWEAEYVAMEEEMIEWSIALLAMEMEEIYEGAEDKERVIGQEIESFAQKIRQVSTENRDTQSSGYIVGGSELAEYLAEGEKINAQIGSNKYLGSIISARTEGISEQQERNRARIASLEKQFRAGVMGQIAYERAKGIALAKDQLAEKIQKYNTTQENVLGVFFDDNGYGIGGTHYTKRVVSTMDTENHEYRTIKIKKYQQYTLGEALTKRLEVALETEGLQEEMYYKSKVKEMEDTIAYVHTAVFGKDHTGGKPGGLLGKHIGRIATLNSDNTKVANTGSGEMGRIFTRYYNETITEQTAWGKFTQAYHRRTINESDTMSDKDKEGFREIFKGILGDDNIFSQSGIDIGGLIADLFKSLADVAVGNVSIAEIGVVAASVVGTIAGAALGGQAWLGAAIGLALSTAVNFTTTLLDVDTGADMEESWENFGKQLALEGTTSIIGAGFSQGTLAIQKRFTSEVGKNFARSVGIGVRDRAIDGASVMVEETMSRYIQAGIYAGFDNDDLGDALAEQFARDKSNGGVGVITVDQLIGLGTRVGGGAVAVGGNRYSGGKLLSNKNRLSEFMGMAIEVGGDYAGRRVASGIEDGWENWEEQTNSKGMNIGLISKKFRVGKKVRDDDNRADLMGLEIGGGSGARFTIAEETRIRASAMRKIGAGARQLMDSYQIRNSRSSFDQKNREVLLAAYSSGGSMKEIAEAMRTGKMSVSVGGERDAVAKTSVGADGKKSLEVSDSVAKMEGDTVVFGTTTQEQLAALTVLAHEGKRDGIVDANNREETRSAVEAHTDMARRIMSEHGSDVFGNTALGKRLLRDMQMQSLGKKAFDSYVDGAYDSSGDYWRMTEDGNLIYDGDGWLKNAEGDYVLKDQLSTNNREYLMASPIFFEDRVIGDKKPAKGLSQIINQHATGEQRAQIDAEAKRLVKAMKTGKFFKKVKKGTTLDTKELVENNSGAIAFPLLDKYIETQASVNPKKKQKEFTNMRQGRKELIERFEAFNHDLSPIYAPGFYDRLKNIDQTRPQELIDEISSFTDVGRTREGGIRKETVSTVYNDSEASFINNVEFDRGKFNFVYNFGFSDKSGSIPRPNATDIARTQWRMVAEEKNKEGYLPRYFVRKSIANTQTKNVINRHSALMRDRDEFIRDVLYETDNGRSSLRIADEFGLKVQNVYMPKVDPFALVENSRDYELLIDLELQDTNPSSQFQPTPLPKRGDTRKQLDKEYGKHPAY